MCTDLVQNRHIPVLLKFGQMPPDKIAQFRRTIVRLFNLGAEAFEHLLGPVTEKLHQNIVFIFEIKIDGSIGHTGLFGDLGDGRLVEALSGKDFDGCFQDKMILIILFSSVDFRPPVSVHTILCQNE